MVNRVFNFKNHLRLLIDNATGLSSDKTLTDRQPKQFDFLNNLFGHGHGHGHGQGHGRDQVQPDGR